MRKDIRFAVLMWLSLAMGGVCVDRVPAAEKPTTGPSVKSQVVYDGWVHVQARKLEPGKSDGKEDSDDSADKSPEVYINQAQSVLCTILDFGDRKLIRCQRLKSKDMIEYDSKYGSIAYGVMNPGLIKKTQEEIAKYPLTPEAHMAILKDAGAIFVRIDEKMDKTFKRMEISFIGGQTCSTCPEGGGLDILWVDPKTNLIRKMQTQIDHPQEITLSYDHKIRNDIYDFGAPRTAKVMDCRPTPEASEILDRFDRYNMDGFGDFVGVLTETDHRKEWGTKKMFLYLYAQEGQKLLYSIYGLNEADYPDSPMREIANWPKVDVRDVLKLARKTIPLMYYATDGTTAWSGRFDNGKDAKNRMVEQAYLLEKHPPSHEYFLVHHFWRNRDAFFLYGYGPKADTITDKDHPGLIGLRLREGDYSTNPKDRNRQERICWVDPKRNDVPVQTIIRGERFNGEQTVSLTRFDTRYLEYARLPNGRWYPTYWKYDASREDLSAKTKGGFGREFHLQVVPNMKLDADWYVRSIKVADTPAKK